MFVIVLTLSADFLAITRALAAKLPQVCINTARIQELEFKPEVTREEVDHWAKNYIASGRYDKVEIIRR